VSVYVELIIIELTRASWGEALKITARSVLRCREYAEEVWAT
jgi:hypothetical protein